ncbi:hypothetical protein EDD18DRAFT_1335237 [Armillaria luteobubalina]|uniref:Uncharacterized protein n=1 Tax=Armillaria luteobubalina TaxID=153913 RepID=A0AA39UG85_9AGAR|nr:hypothetical protein EDD18DRAFT_1335237 [Armillaria luteobubalina]
MPHLRCYCEYERTRASLEQGAKKEWNGKDKKASRKWAEHPIDNQVTRESREREILRPKYGKTAHLQKTVVFKMVYISTSSERILAIKLSIYAQLKRVQGLSIYAIDLRSSERYMAVLYGGARGVHSVGTYIVHGSRIPVQYGYGARPYSSVPMDDYRMLPLDQFQGAWPISPSFVTKRTGRNTSIHRRSILFPVSSGIYGYTAGNHCYGTRYNKDEYQTLNLGRDTGKTRAAWNKDRAVGYQGTPSATEEALDLRAGRQDCASG